jgi:hypothetical protein
VAAIARVATHVPLSVPANRCGGDGPGTVTPVVERSIPRVLREHASLQPNDTAITFIDYEQDWAGVAESLTWSQLYRRSLNLAQELSLRGSTGDRTVILAPQGLNYIDAFLTETVQPPCVGVS